MDDTDYALGRSEAEYERLVEQGDVMRPMTERLFRAAGLGPGMRVLDVGCGVAKPTTHARPKSPTPER